MIDPALHHFPARFDGDGISQRLRKPIAQPAGAHGRDSSIQRPEKRCIARRIMTKRLEHFQMPQRSAVQDQVISGLIERKRRQVRDIPPQMLRQVVQHGSSCANGRRFVFSPNPSSEATLNDPGP